MDFITILQLHLSETLNLEVTENSCRFYRVCRCEFVLRHPQANPPCIELIPDRRKAKYLFNIGNWRLFLNLLPWL